MDVFGGNGNRSSWHNPGKQMEGVEIGKKNQLLLYASGKKLITIDFLTENYEYLEETLKRNGKY